ncbi:hypothetical protein TNCV_3363871 [Trichonephila clavipes]|nr:hypothetical protein TNCV_3363871 [Trichonephila clavipes]
MYHQEVKKVSEKQVRQTPPAKEPRGENAGSGFSLLLSPPLPGRAERRRSEEWMPTASAPPLSSSLGKFALPARPLHAPPPFLPRLLLKTRVWKDLKRIWNPRNQRCKNRSWCPRCRVRFLKVTVGIRSRTQGPQSLARRIGVEFKSLHAQAGSACQGSDPWTSSNTEPEDIKTENRSRRFQGCENFADEQLQDKGLHAFVLFTDRKRRGCP